MLGDRPRLALSLGQRISRARLALLGLLVFAATLAALAVSAVACSGGGTKEPTTLTTSLSGEGKEGGEITILEGSKAKDKASLSGKNASIAADKVKYDVYSDNKCEHLVTAAGEVTVSSGSVPASNEEELEGGKTYYWQATYEGDENNSASTSTCGSEILNVKAKTSVSTSLSGGGKEGEEITINEGEKARDKATLSGKNSSTAGGKVTYKVYSDSKCEHLVTAAGEETVSAGSVPASSEEELEGGKTYYWQAHYAGDSLHQESTSTCGKEILDVKAKTSLSTSLSGGGKEGEELSINEGSKATDKATLSGTNSSTASGKATYKVYSDSKCEHLVKEAGEETVSSGSVPASSEEELEGGKTYYWQAHYAGDSLHQESTSTCGKEILDVKAKTSLSTTLSGGGKEGEEITVDEGEKAKDKATLTGTNSSGANGTAIYKVYSDSKCEHLIKEAGEVTVSSGSVPASSEQELEGGTAYYWQAHYSGDSLHQESTSTCDTEVLDVRAITSLATSLEGAGLSGDEIVITEEEAVNDTATISGTKVSTATGSVKYDIYSDSKCEHLVAEVSEGAVSGGVAPRSSEEVLAEGIYYWQAAYSGDATHTASTSTCGKEVQTVKANTQLLTALSGEEQSGEEIEVLGGTAVSDTAILTGTNESTATGTVSYNVYSDPECEELVAHAGEVSITEGTVPPSSKETLSAGTYYWQAVYSGDANNAAYTSTCDEEVLIIDAETSLTTSLSGGGHSGESITVSEGTALTDEAALTGAHASEATGTVMYDVYSDDECEDLVAEAGEEPIAGGSVPASSEITLPGGTYYWQAIYSGDGINHASKSVCGDEIAVVKAATSLSSSLSGGGQDQADITVLEGTGVTDQAALTGENTGIATGTVKYDVYSDDECKDLVAEAGEATVTDGAVSASSDEMLPAGKYYWQAVYSGDSADVESTSTCGQEVATVDTMMLTASMSGEEETGDDIEVLEGSGIIDTATLSGEDFTATGTVKYDVYSDDECKDLVAEAGEASVIAGVVSAASTEETLAAGTYYMQATYSGDGSHPELVTTCAEQVVKVNPGPKPVLEEVYFKKSYLVTLDHTVKKNGDAGSRDLTIFNFPKPLQNTLQWKTAKADGGVVAKNWPIVYVQNTPMEIEAKFAPDPIIKGLALKKELEGEIEFEGSTTIFKKPFKFTLKQTIAELEAQLGKPAPSLISTGIIKTPALPMEVGYQQMVIKWSWTVEIKGRGKVKEDLKDSTHNLYVTYAAPAIEPVRYFTIFDIAGEREAGNPRAPVLGEGETIKAIWSGFTINAPSPETFARTYEPASGTIGTRPKPMTYWPSSPAGMTLEKLLPSPPRPPTSLEDLLKKEKGYCGAWARAMVAALRSEGIVAKFATIKPIPGKRNNNLLVKNWTFKKAGRIPGSEITRGDGIEGQGTKNPWALFANHELVIAENKETVGKPVYQMYDPSYGTGPWSYMTPKESDAKLEAYEAANLSGLCGLSAPKIAECGPVKAKSLAIKKVVGDKLLDP